jgi:hypothetical protein
VSILGKTTGLKAGVNENGVVEHAALLCRLYVNEHVGNARVALLDCIFY